MALDLGGLRLWSQGDGVRPVLPALTVEGYLVDPENALTLAISFDGPEPPEELLQLWERLEREGVAVRSSRSESAEGKAVMFLTLRTDPPEADLELLRSAVECPARSDAGLLELHVIATESELARLERVLRSLGAAVASASRTGLTAPGPDQLSNEDWAFLGLVEAARERDGALADDAQEVGARLGIDRVQLEHRVRGIERGLQGLVTRIFDDGPAELGRLGGGEAPG